jgi:outer membrane receptor protein involved in Fe transport
MGGLIKYVTVDPSTMGWSGRLQAGTDGIHHGTDAGYNVRGAVNIPLGDTIAVRASGFSRQEPGYIYNLASGERGVNKTDTYGGRIAALWKPADNWSLRLSALMQESKRDGSDQVDSGLGDLQQDNLRGTGWLHRKNQAYSAILSGKVGDVTITSLSGYNVYSFSTSFDATAFFSSFAQSFFGVTGASLPEDLKNERFSQEIRASFPIGQFLDWLWGGYFSNEHTTWHQLADAIDPATGVNAGLMDSTTYPNTYKDYAVFTNLTFHLMDRFDLQVGGRESADRQTFGQTDTTYIGVQLEGGDLSTLHAKENSFTYLVTPEFKISPDLMAYARLASGFRPGSPNPIVPGVLLPAKSNPDKTQTYEIGFKGDVLDHALSFDASVYYIDWKNIQLPLFQGSFSYTVNGGSAKSEGVEISMNAKPWKGFTINTWLAFDDAVLTEDLPAGSTAAGLSGDRLPLSSRFSGALSVNQDFLLPRGWLGFLGASVSYVGDRLYNFQGIAGDGTPLPRQLYPTYAQTDLRAGTRWDTWSLSVYANNVTDRRGVIGGGLGTINPLAFNYIQPRTVGLSVAKSF